MLMQRLSSSHELTALRSASFSLTSVLMPIIVAAMFISLANFYVLSELSTSAHLESNLLKNELRSVNPLLLLHNKHLMKGKGIFFETLGASKMGENAQDIVIAIPNNENNTVNLLVAKNLQTENDGFTAEGLTIISSPGGKTKGGSIHLLVENIGSTQSSVEDFAHFIQKKVTTVSNDHLNMGLLLIRLQEYRRLAEIAKSPEEKKEISKAIRSSYSEIFRRLSAALAPFFFTLLGLSFGTSIGRKQSTKRIFFAVLLAAFYLIAFFTAKGVGASLLVTAAIYLTPHLVIALFSLFYLRRISQGVA